jgi:TM2 domain-containing membrane protein YozV
MTNSPPAAAAGWYSVPSGGRRYWDGKQWTNDVLGAPNAAAEYAALSPDLPTPGVLAPQAPAQMHPAGWYPRQGGAMQWWDGYAWGPFAPPTVVRSAKEVGIAYLFLLLLGGFAAHRFYLGAVSSAVVFNLLWWGGWLLSGFIIGVPLVFAAGIWLLVDLFLLPGMVRQANSDRLRQP